MNKAIFNYLFLAAICYLSSCKELQLASVNADSQQSVMKKAQVNAVPSYTFLKAAGPVIRNEAGTGDIVNLRGTNLGSWLTFEYWMMPLGTGSLDRSQWTATASSTLVGTQPNHVFDRDQNTRWSNGSAQVPDGSQTFTVDMQQDVLFNRLQIETGAYPGDFNRSFRIEVSSDGSNWETVAEQTGADTSIVYLNIIAKRYVRITNLGTATNNYWSISEFNAFMEDDLHVRKSLALRFGENGADEVIDAFQDTWITSTDLDYIKDMGMNLVRVPFYWKEVMNADGTIKNNGFKQLDWIIAQCATRQMYVVLDLHGAPSGINGYITSGEAITNNYWTDAEAQSRTKAIWQAVATRYKDNPTVAMYDVLNEPRVADNAIVPGATTYAQRISYYYNELYNAIRAVDPDHIICFNAFYDFGDILPPQGTGSYNWDNVVYQVHYYAEENKFNPAGMSATIDYLLKRIGYFQHTWSVPVLVGEFNCWSDMNNWSKFLDGLNELNTSWTNWAYKTTRVDTNPTENWGFFQGVSALPPAPDLHYDDFAVIKTKWQQYGTFALSANTTLINTVGQRTSSPVSLAPINSTISLKGNNGLFVTTNGNDNPMTCDRAMASGWELFEVVDAGDGKVALKGSNNLYVSIGNGTDPMICNMTAIGATEKFTFIKVGNGKVALMGGNNLFVSSENGSNPMICDKNTINEWETFEWEESTP